MTTVFTDFYKHSQFKVKFSPNNQHVANIASDDKRLVIRHHDERLEVVHVFESSRTMDYIQWSPNSELILYLNRESNRIEIRSVIDSKWKCVLRDEGFPIERVKWSSDSKSVLCISELKLRLAIWNVSTETLKYVNHLKYSEKGIEISPDGKYLAVAERRDGKDYISIYHARSFILLQSFPVNTVDLENLKWSPDNMYLAVYDNCLHHTLLVYRQDGALCTTYNGYEFGLGIKSINWSPNGEILAVGNYDQTIHLLNTNSWERIVTFDHPSKLKSIHETNLIEEVTLPETNTTPTLHQSADYRHVLKRPYQLPTLRLENIESNPKIGIGSCQFSADGSYICSKNDNMPRVLFIWNIRSLECTSVIVFRQSIKQSVWSPNSDHELVVCCGDSNIHVLTPTKEGIEIFPLSLPTRDDPVIRRVKWSQDGTSLALMDQFAYCLAVMSGGQ